MDRYLAFLKPDETASQLYARTFVEPLVVGVPFLDRCRAVRPGQILEVAGPSGCGKTETLIQICAFAILPRHFEGVLLGGRQERVLLIDLDCRFDVLRLVQVLTARLAACAPACPSHVVDEGVLACLANFHLVQTPTSFELLAVLRCLPANMAAMQQEGGVPGPGGFGDKGGGPGQGQEGGARGLRLVLVDNVDACYWMNRAVRPSPMGPNGDADCGLLTARCLASLVPMLLREAVLSSEARVAAVVTRYLPPFQAQGPGGGDGSPGGWGIRDNIIPRPWQEVVYRRLLLQRVEGGGSGSPHILVHWQGPSQQDAQGAEVEMYCTGEAAFQQL